MTTVRMGSTSLPIRTAHVLIEFDSGRDPYGGRMAPEPLIRALYPRDAVASFSVARSNAEQLHAEGTLTGLIEFDRGQWAEPPAPGPHAPAMQHRSTEAGMRVSTAAARSRSTTAKRRPGPQEEHAQQTPNPGSAAARQQPTPDERRGRSR